MLNDIKDSIKAKLYDFTYTPFMSSVVISWVILNHKYLLIYFADFDLDKKLILLKNHDFAYHSYGYYLPCAYSFWFPIVFGLFYVYGYPRISKEFYEYTLKRTKELKGIKQSIEDETPMTLAEAREIRKLASTLEEEKDKAVRSLSKRDEEWQFKLDNALDGMNSKLVDLKSDVVAATGKITELETERDALQTKLTQSNKFLQAKNDECDQLKKEIEELKKKLPPATPRLPLGDVHIDISDSNGTLKTTQAYESVMHFLNDSFDPMNEVHLVDKIVKETHLGKTLVRHILHSLIDDQILINDAGTIKMTREGAGKVVDYAEKHPPIPF